MKHNSDLENYINKCIQKEGSKNPSMDQLNAYLADYMQGINNQPCADFEGYSSTEMHMILDLPFEQNCPFSIETLPQGDYEYIPIFRQVKRLLQIIDGEGTIKLTATGTLPVRIVKELYPLGIVDLDTDKELSKLNREADLESAQLTRGLVEISGLAKKQKGVLSLTKKCKTVLADDEKLFRLIFEPFCTKFNWAYFDSYEMQQIGQMGFGFSLILVGKYGEKERTDMFYAQKYFAAFPKLKEGVIPQYRTLDEYCGHCYSLRTFYCFMKHLGLVEIRKEKGIGAETFVVKTAIFDKFIKIEPHKEFHTPVLR